MKRKKTILYLGASGFPFGSATIQRQIQLSKSLILAGFKVTVINRRGGHSKTICERENIKYHGFYQNIEYYYASLIPYKSKYFIPRNIFKLLGYMNEFFFILYYKYFKNAKFILFRTYLLSNVKYYYFVSKLLKIQLIYDYVEFYDSLGKREITNIKDLKKEFDYKFYNYTDKIIVISEYLVKHVNHFAPDKLKLKIPAIIDFDYYDGLQVLDMEEESFFLFCGSASYLDIIKFIIEAFVNSKSIAQKVKLKLVLNGNNNDLIKIEKIISQTRYKGAIFLLSKLSYKDLVLNYKSAIALLIPITNNVQDQARFPFKICEYTASKKPIITSNAGVIREYFEHNENALIGEPDQIEDLIKNMNFVIDNPKLAKKIGLNGYELGKKVFNFKNYSKKLQFFLKS